MTEEGKRTADFVLAIVAMAGAAIPFYWAIYEWRQAQKWRKAEHLDKIVEWFNRDDLLRLARIVVDWTARRVTFGGRQLTITNDDVLLALRIHDELETDSAGLTCKFDGEQATIRDGYDALLMFFERLELAISSNLILTTHARSYFSYWVRRFINMEAHPDSNNVLQGVLPSQKVQKYIEVYGDECSMKRLCEVFAIPWKMD